MNPELVICINLDRRTQRWEDFLANLPSDWVLGPVKRFSGVDGAKLPLPSWWRGTPGMYGCFQSHLRIWEHAIVTGCENVLILEDDARFVKDFSWRASALLRNVPANWDQIYFGGHCCLPDEPMVNEHFVRTRGVVCTHCYIVRRRFFTFLYERLVSFAGENSVWNVDKQLLQLHKLDEFNIYRPLHWLCFQCSRLNSDTRDQRVETIYLEKGRYRITSEGVWPITRGQV